METSPTNRFLWSTPNQRQPTADQPFPFQPPIIQDHTLAPIIPTPNSFPTKKSTCFLEETMIPNYHRLESILSMISFLHHSHKGHCPATVLANDRRTSIVIMYANAIAECNGRCNGLNIIPLMTGALDTTHPEHPASLIKCSSPILVTIAIIIIW